MNKDDFIKILKQHKKNVVDVVRQCHKFNGKQIHLKNLLTSFESLGTMWFEEIDQQMQSAFKIDNEILEKYRESFGKLLEMSGTHPAKTTAQGVLDDISRNYHTDILVPVQKHHAALAKYPKLDNILLHASGLEIEYLIEAIDCARLGKNRAALILGWCAAVDRLHGFIEKEGFSKFNQASTQMSLIQSGRYKRFNKKFTVQNLSELRMNVFDNDLLWILEFLGAIDGNQHDRLEICLTMRDTSAHPGESRVSEENVSSFFSDIDSLVFTNPKLKI
jgi:hypothetical protein